MSIHASPACIAAFAFSFAVAPAAPIHADPPTYHAEFLGESSGAAAINESGRLVGSTTAFGPIRAWVAGPGSPLALLPLPAGFVSSWATDVNDAGVIVGAISASVSPEFGGHAAMWQPDGVGGYGAAEDLGLLPGHAVSNATALNDVGDIVGTSSNGMFRYPVLFTPDGPVDLTATGIFDPQDVNDRRVVVDRSFTTKRLDLNTMAVEDLGVPPGGSPSYLATTAAAINEQNQVAGVAILATSTDCDRQAARYTDEIGWEIFSTCGPYNGASDINDRGDVVMRINLAQYVRFEDLGTFPIEDLILEENGHWYVFQFGGAVINTARQIVVFAQNLVTDEAGVVLLTPVADGPAEDLDGDGAVGFSDLLILLAEWGACTGPCPADLDADGQVGFTDLVALLAAWS